VGTFCCDYLACFSTSKEKGFGRKIYLFHIFASININHINLNNQKKDEDAFEKMTNIIEGLRREEELIYCDLKPAKKKTRCYNKIIRGCK